MNTNLELFRDLLAGQADPAARAALRAEIDNPDSETRRFLEGLQLATINGFRVGPTPPADPTAVPVGRPERRLPRTAVFTAAAAVLVAIGFGALALRSYSELQEVRDREHSLIAQADALADQSRHLARDLGDLRQENARLRNQTNLARGLENDPARRDAIARALTERLTQSLADKSPAVRQQAAAYLGILGRAAEAALPAVRQRLALERDPTVHQELSYTITKIEQGK
jgi:hypothetical protein